MKKPTIFFVLISILFISCINDPIIRTLPENLIFVEGGTFVMGDHLDEGYDNELPLHDVTLSDFRISKYEVTHTEYIEFLNSIGVDPDGYYNGYWLINIDSELCAINHNGSDFYFEANKRRICVSCGYL